MPTIRIKIEGLAEAMRKLHMDANELSRRASKAAGLAVIGEAKLYPAPSGNPQPFVSDKQRRYFFAALKDGRITVPYRRTYDLQDAWQFVPQGNDGDVVNESPHARWTIVKGQRAKYHKGTWRDEYQIAQDATEEARDKAEEAVLEYLRESVDAF